MKKFLYAITVITVLVACGEINSTPPPEPAVTPTKIELLEPNFAREGSMMNAFKNRHSTREFSSLKLTEADLSDLMWATFGVNRDNGKFTAPKTSSMTILVYVYMEKGIYQYDNAAHELNLIKEGDFRSDLSSGQTFVEVAPVSILTVADITKYSDKNLGTQVASIICGTIHQNINLFCASAGLVTVPRMSMDTYKIITNLGLNNNQIPIFNNTVGYSN